MTEITNHQDGRITYGTAYNKARTQDCVPCSGCSAKSAQVFIWLEKMKLNLCNECYEKVRR